jgi:hypothetical protein
MQRDVVHLWFMIKGPNEVLPVPGAKVTALTQYAYAIADLVTSPVTKQVFQRAGKNPILISRTTLTDEGKKQTAEIIFTNGRKIILKAYTPIQLPTPLKLGGHIWNYHAGGCAEMGENNGTNLDPTAGNPHNLNKTSVMFLGLAPGPPKTTQVTIHAEPGTAFADYFGISDAVASHATFFKPDNIVNNSSCGDLIWKTNPPYPVPAPPAIPK